MAQQVPPHHLLAFGWLLVNENDNLTLKERQHGVRVGAGQPPLLVHARPLRGRRDGAAVIGDGDVAQPALPRGIDHVFDGVAAIVNDKDVAPDGATFEDGYRNAVICDAILKSSEEGRKVSIEF